MNTDKTNIFTKISKIDARTKRTFLICCYAVLAITLIISGIKMFQIYRDYAKEANLKQEMLQYKPNDLSFVDPNGNGSGLPSESLLKAQERNPDIIGWITLDNTAIDYPFVHSKDNYDYLRTDIDGNYAMAGTVFVDYRCQKDFLGWDTVIYGHNLKNGAMFNDLEKFADETFFEENTTGTIWLNDGAHRLEIFAYLQVDANDDTIYSFSSMDAQAEKEIYLQYVRNTAQHFREPQLDESSHIVTLSTCSYSYSTARYVVLAKIAMADKA